MKAAKLEIGIRSQESGARKESEGRRKKCFCKYEMLPKEGARRSVFTIIRCSPLRDSSLKK
ncbi:hypothetical protein [Microcoleus sp. D2_18a_B4]|uniref:hypothetical protein n=1 Tax=Microcoleus sp. D2_18a_B4 TaxID=3055329 RepID=UPI002FD76B48